MSERPHIRQKYIKRAAGDVFEQESVMASASLVLGFLCSQYKQRLFVCASRAFCTMPLDVYGLYACKHIDPIFAIQAEVEQPVDMGHVAEQQEEELFSPVRRAPDCCKVAHWSIAQQHFQS